MNPIIKVAIVEDNLFYRMALANVILANKSLCLHGLYASSEEALDKIPVDVPDVVLIDISLGAINGIEAVRILSSACTNTHFIMCTVDEEPDSAYRAFAAGANGYILKYATPEEMVAAIKEIVIGGSPLSRTIARSLVKRFRTQPASTAMKQPQRGLSLREEEILQLLNKGKLNKEIACDLGISIETVRKHVHHIYKKMGVNNRVEMFHKVNRLIPA